MSDIRIFSHDTSERDVLGVLVPVATLENIIRGKVWAWQDEQRRFSKAKEGRTGSHANR